MTRAEYEAKYVANTKYTGMGLETTINEPCPFCAEPGFRSYRILEVTAAIAKEAVCGSCGRGARAIVTKKESTTLVEILQTCGDDPPPFMKWMRRSA